MADVTDAARIARLERLSDDVRKGHSLGLAETLEVIDYQDRLRRERSASQGSVSAVLSWVRKALRRGQ
jgi:hypothetical protein